MVVATGIFNTFALNFKINHYGDSYIFRQDIKKHQPEKKH